MRVTQSMLFLGAFAKFRKATISFVMSACPSVRMVRHDSHQTDFHEILHLRSFLRSVEKNQNFIKIGQERRGLYMKTTGH